MLATKPYIIQKRIRDNLDVASTYTGAYKQKLRNARRKLRAAWARRVAAWNKQELCCKPHHRAILRAIKAAKKAAR